MRREDDGARARGRVVVVEDGADTHCVSWWFSISRNGRAEPRIVGVRESQYCGSEALMLGGGCVSVAEDVSAI